MIHITDEAAKQLRSLIAERGEGEGCGLRLGVEKGGCAGLQYAMSLGTATPTDTVVDAGEARVFIDADSTSYLEGMTLDYTNELTGAGFRIKNPNATRSCGCGTSFEPAEKTS